MERHEPVTLEVILGLVKQLSAVEKLKLVERVLVELEPIVEAQELGKRRSLRGILKGRTFTDEEIEAARRELWGAFGEREL